VGVPAPQAADRSDEDNIALALSAFDRAKEIAPRHALTAFRKAKLLLSLDNLNVWAKRTPCLRARVRGVTNALGAACEAVILQDALEELLWTRDIAPLEASVHKLLAEVYRRLKRPQEALRALMMARDLDPRSITDPGQDAAYRLNEDLEETDAVPEL